MFILYLTDTAATIVSGQHIVHISANLSTTGVGFPYATYTNRIHKPTLIWLFPDFTVSTLHTYL